MSNSKTILFLNGPNLNMLGSRKKAHYGDETLMSIESRLRAHVEAKGCSLLAYQSNYEGDLITRIQNAQKEGVVGIIINPGGLTHTSVSLRDAVEIARDLGVPSVEVHLSDIEKREEFRRESLLSPGAPISGNWVVLDRIVGKKSLGYFEAADILIEKFAVPT